MNDKQKYTYKVGKQIFIEDFEEIKRWKRIFNYMIIITLMANLLFFIFGRSRFDNYRLTMALWNIGLIGFLIVINIKTLMVKNEIKEELLRLPSLIELDIEKIKDDDYIVIPYGGGVDMSGYPGVYNLNHPFLDKYKYIKKSIVLSTVPDDVEVSHIGLSSNMINKGTILIVPVMIDDLRRNFVILIGNQAMINTLKEASQMSFAN